MDFRRLLPEIRWQSRLSPVSGTGSPDWFFDPVDILLQRGATDIPAHSCGEGAGTRGQTGQPANFRQETPEIHGSLVSPRRAPSPEGQFFMKLRGPKAHPNRQPISGKLRRKSESVPGLRRIAAQRPQNG